MISLFKCIVWFLVVFNLSWVKCNDQFGPDPWHNSHNNLPVHKGSDFTVPPDLKPVEHPKKAHQNSNNVGDWFYKRMLAIFLKGGQIKENEEYVEISMNMKLSKQQWNILDKYIRSPGGLTEEMYRRSVAFIEEGIYKPTVTDKVIMAWTNYIQVYLNMYKMEIMYCIGGLIFLAIAFTLWSMLTSRQIKILSILCVYIYEVFISYKEAEQKEYEKFVSAVNRCNWLIWSSKCDVPAPDMLLFLKHMHPLKIAVRILSYAICEPMVTISSTVNDIIGGITDGLWFPVNKIVGGFLLVGINLTIIMLLIIILFNFILNIPFNLSFFAGLITFGVKQRKRTIIEEPESISSQTANNNDRISGTNLNKLLTIMANTYKKVTPTSSPVLNNNKLPLKKSASAGRLMDLISPSNNIKAINFKSNERKRRGIFSNGGGDR